MIRLAARGGRFYVAASLAVNDALFHVPNYFIFYNLGRRAPAVAAAPAAPAAAAVGRGAWSRLGGLALRAAGGRG